VAQQWLESEEKHGWETGKKQMMGEEMDDPWRDVIFQRLYKDSISK